MVKVQNRTYKPPKKHYLTLGGEEKDLMGLIIWTLKLIFAIAIFPLVLIIEFTIWLIELFGTAIQTPTKRITSFYKVMFTGEPYES